MSDAVPHFREIAHEYVKWADQQAPVGDESLFERTSKNREHWRLAK